MTFIQRDCNYLQALRAIFICRISVSCTPAMSTRTTSPNPVRNTVINRAPEYHPADTEWGTQYAGYRYVGGGRTYWRFGNFLFPFWSQAPNGEFATHMHARGWVPLDDEHTMYVFLSWKKAVHAGSLPQPAFKDGSPIGGTGRANNLLPNTTDWLGRWRMAANESNDWEVDRDAQRTNRIYSGIDGIHLQDQAITESMGSIVDHEFEHLAPSDQMITRTRRRLLMAARALREKGTVPPGADNPEVYRKVGTVATASPTRCEESMAEGIRRVGSLLDSALAVEEAARAAIVARPGPMLA